MTACVILNLLNELAIRDQMQSLQSILSSLFLNEFNKFKNAAA